MGISYQQYKKSSNYKSVMFRKINQLENGKRVHPDKQQLKKQIITLHKKLQKNDPELVTEFAIEQDYHLNKYHSHLLVKYTDESNLLNQLQRFIGGSKWGKRIEGWNEIYYCYGKYGEVDVISVYDAKRFRGYLNKSTSSRTLI